jgi:hypothetical protein
MNLKRIKPHSRIKGKKLWMHTDLARKVPIHHSQVKVSPTRNIELVTYLHGHTIRPVGREVYPFLRTLRSELGENMVILTETTLPGLLPPEMRENAIEIDVQRDPYLEKYTQRLLQNSKMALVHGLIGKIRQVTSELLWFRKKIHSMIIN